MPARPPPPFSLRRAVLLGLCLGCLVGGLALVVRGVRALRGDVACGALSAQECAFEREVAREFAHRQVVGGGALALLGVVLLVPLRAAWRPAGRA